jgi:predicted nucleic acid-binding protein
MSPEDAKSKMQVLIKDRRVRCLNITKSISLYSLDLASEFYLGGRDSLIVGCYLRNRVDVLLTHDRELLDLGRLRFRGQEIEFKNPIRGIHE